MNSPPPTSADAQCPGDCPVVLLVDDDANLLCGLLRALHNQPYHIYTARGGDEAMHVCKTRSIDLIVSDEHMSGMQGTDLLSWVAREFPDVVRILLGNSIPGARNAADVCGLAIGADGLVVLHQDSVEGVSLDGRSLWTAPLPSPPVRWGVALSRKQCAVTLSDGLVVCFGDALEGN